MLGHKKRVTPVYLRCHVYVKRHASFCFQEGRTESIKNELDPRFVRAFQLEYYFETVQKMKVAVYDMDNSTESLKDDDFLGQVECTLGQVSGYGRLNGMCMFWVPYYNHVFYTVIERLGV